MKTFNNIPSDSKFEVVSKIGRLKYQVLFERGIKPLDCWNKFTLAGMTAAVVQKLGFEIKTPRGSVVVVDDLNGICLSRAQIKAAIELSGEWFEYETGDNGDVVCRSKVDWVTDGS
jgi:hypothetical protein